MYADVANKGKPQRIDTFNGNYGLNRGLRPTDCTARCSLANDNRSERARVNGNECWQTFKLLFVVIVSRSPAATPLMYLAGRCRR